MNTRKPTTLAACLIVSMGALTIFSGTDARGAGPADQYKDELKTLLNQRVETAQKAHDAMRAAFEAETVTLDQLLDAMNKLVEAELAVATKPEEEIAVLARHVELMKQTEAKTEALYKEGARGGEQAQYYAVKRERESAEIALLKARIRTAR